eukprot:CAMPEP_0171323746 /NCGR_PEP_ID=MMETSP0816-20121228/115766_1 /TAXON_ID=420281 /ORGANISM="Proboscia inermis, Strain CCAP1064/1" /LENGTH=460 /DNA_ID=CAMNT_0011822531 /DNA_START=208 /DNA_END=1591 /DNA_ORIENTATION=-
MSERYAPTNVNANGNLPLSKHILPTLDPCIILMKELISKHADKWQDRGGIYSLAQGIVYWNPPSTVATTLTALLNSSTDEPSDLHTYGPADGLPELTSALTQKLKSENGITEAHVMVTAGANQAYANVVPETEMENGITEAHVMVTAGANQAYANVVLTLLDEETAGVVFAPYYFNHVMALQMTAGVEGVITGPTVGGIPDVEWLRGRLHRNAINANSERAISMVTVVNPGNPTGVTIPLELMQRLADVCAEYSAWFVVDSTYEHFVHEPTKTTPNTNTNEGAAELAFEVPHGNHVINIFSFSKAFSLAGYRVGYLTISKTQSVTYQQLLKVQDTIPICVARMSQHAALAALSAGRHWVQTNVDTLSPGRRAMQEALSNLPTVVGGSGAMYLMGELPSGVDDVIFAETLVEEYGVAVIPGSYCGLPGWIRVCYSNLEPEQCRLAARRLKDGIDALVTDRR